MFKMLVFLVASPYVLITSRMAVACLYAGQLAEGLPFAALALMSFSYFLKGVLEAADQIKGKIL